MPDEQNRHQYRYTETNDGCFAGSCSQMLLTIRYSYIVWPKITACQSKRLTCNVISSISKRASNWIKVIVWLGNCVLVGRNGRLKSVSSYW